MKTLDLTEKRITLDELLELAGTDSLRILTADGRAFVSEKADDFDKKKSSLARQEQEVSVLSQRTVQGSGDNLVGGLQAVT